MRALLDDPGLAGAPDAVRLATVVLTARTPSTSGVVEIRVGELGRWLGLSTSHMASKVIPALRRSGVVSIDTHTGELGQHDGLECRVLPLWEARGTAGHPLALRRTEFATLLRLLEAVIAPGWTHRDGRVTPSGLLKSRVGRGAATDRLALLLLVLEASETGRVRQCGGKVDTKRGRAAATVARLLGCTASAGERILERLEDRGLVQRVRARTSSGLEHRTRLIVPTVAAAHGQRGASHGQEYRATAPSPDFSEPDVAAGDSEASEPLTEPQVTAAPVADRAGVTEPDVTAALHTDHSPVVTPACSPALSGGFSGEGRDGFGNRPECARKREDQAIDGKAGDQSPLDSGAGGPLRGEQREKSLSISEKSGRGPVVGALVRVDGAGQGRLQQGRVSLPPEDLRTVLAPVDLVWARLERSGARQLVVAAARSELKAVEGFAGCTDAPQLLAYRLARRLSEQLRTGGPITDPVGWLLARGLPQRQECGDVRCDDRILLGTGRDCPRCEDRQEERRAQRHAVAADVDAAMPYASDAERQVVTAQRLHQEVTVRAWARQADWEQARARHAAARARTEDETERAAAVPAAPVAPVVPAPRPVAALDPVVEDVNQEQELVLEDLTREQVLDWRTRAAHDPQIVFDHIDRYGKTSARKLFTGRLVDQVQRLLGLGHLDLGYIPWGQA
ncbi:hypothetical protein ACWDG1_30135 [Streptomyces sp. NPDC001177]